MEKEPLILALLDNSQLCLGLFQWDCPPKREQLRPLFKNCPSLFIDDKFKQIDFAHKYGWKDSLLEAMYPMGPFESIVNAENDVLCSLPTFKVRDKHFFVDPNAMKALRKQRLLENIHMGSGSLARSNIREGDLNGLIDAILDC